MSTVSNSTVWWQHKNSLHTPLREVLKQPFERGTETALWERYWNDHLTFLIFNMQSLGWQTTNSVHLHTIFPQSLSSVGCSPGPDRTTHEGRAHSHGHHHGGAHRRTHTWTHTCTEQNSNLNTGLLGLTTVNSKTLPLKNTSTSNLQCLLGSRQAALGVIYRVRWAGPAPGWVSAAALTSAV